MYRTLQLLLILFAFQAHAQPEIPANLKIRNIGPANMSGRITAIDAVHSNPKILYVGAASGGVWKSENGGSAWNPVFDAQPTQNIGALAIQQSNPAVVWVGTGEGNPRNSMNLGMGIFRSSDGGKTWQHLGLEATKTIHRICLDPIDSNTVYVGAMGDPFTPGTNRGLYKTTDGGNTWKQILFTNESSGVADLVMDPRNPKKLLAALYEHRRTPYSFTSGGPGSGLFLTTDGGDSWKKLGPAEGLPSGDLGRIGIAIAPSNPDRVYAKVEAAKNALYRSDDAGKTWKMVNDNPKFTNNRPFYFQDLAVDSKNPDRLYNIYQPLTVSYDGGVTFDPVPMIPADETKGIHADFHAFWVNTSDPQHFIIGGDGGIGITYDHGKSWYFPENIPVAQFYHVSADNETPYNVYGGLQVNGSWYAPSAKAGGIANSDWKPTLGGDGFWSFPHPNDHNIVFSEYQGGNLVKFNKVTGTAKDIRPFPLNEQEKLRFNWNAPIHISPNNPKRMYFGAQFLFMSEDKGESWKKISPDLTTNDPAKQQQEESGGITYDNSSAENHCTIFAIAESPRNEKTIWVGTDDGNIQVTRDAGTTWTLVSKGIPGLPAPYSISCIEPMAEEDGGAYVTIDGHMWGDMESYIYKTLDFGKTWKRIGAGQIKGYTHVIREDLVNRKLLFVGTEFGLFLSIDQGENFVQMDHNNNVPNVAVRDIRIQGRYHDLVLATHGRGIMIIDDIRPLRMLSQELMAKSIHIFEPEPYAVPENGFDYFAFGDDEYTALNPRDGFMVKYYLQKKLMTGDFYVDVCDGSGKKITSQILGKRKGLNFVEVPLSSPPPKMPPGPRPAYAGFIAAPLPEGEYKLRFVKDKDTLWSKVNLIHQERSIHSKEDKQIRHQYIARTHKLCNDFSYTVMSATKLRDQAREMAAKPECSAVKKQLNALATSLDDLHNRVVSTKEGMIADDGKFLRDRISRLYSQVVSYQGKPSKTQTDKTETFEKEVTALEKELNDLLQKQLPGINKQLTSAKQGVLERMTREQFDAKK